MTKASLDTNIVVYAFQEGPKEQVARAVLAEAPFASVQLLNEYAHVVSRKYDRDWRTIEEDVLAIRALLARVDPITADHNRDALRIAARYRLAFYDALMLAVALSGGARTFYSEDMQHDLVIDDALRIVDPFRPGALST